MRYAATTDVPVFKSRAEIEAILTRYGVTEKAFLDSTGKAAIQFHLGDRVIRFVLSLPSASDKQFTHHRVNANSDALKARTPEKAREAWEQACRQKWRALALSIKAKLEAVESNIATLEEEFMAQIVMPDGHTVAEHVLPKISQAYQTKEVPPLLTFGA